ncbi:MAG: hypothetical protein EHM17_14520 [Verrucomicrobiaceae bacterium]|nr:MAG: hypothetical protein EHM17_14520 [Verrucomicrobiaceae bacterium]
MTIKLVEAAEYFKKLPHQIDAWNWFESQTSKEVLEAFAVKYRTAPQPVETYPNTWDGVMKAGKDAGAKYPEVVAAQWALESNWGKDTSGTHNYYGLKGSGTTVNTQEFINGQWVTIKAGFLDFPDLYTCTCYLVDRWYKDYGTYKGVNRATSRNNCADLLVVENYATDPAYSTKLIQIMDRQLGTPGGNTIDVVTSKTLSVPYFYQLDNVSGTGYRECFSSSCAMISAYYGLVKSDDEYNAIRAKYGDTTNKDAQLATLHSLGLKAKFITNGNAALLENELRNGRPVAVGWLHQGNVNYPTGGGHWTCCVGFTPDAFVHNDPNGEADMVNGGYVSNSASRGKGVKYSRKNWLRRWECDGNNTGWAIIVSK